MKLVCKLGNFGEQVVEVQKTDCLSVLMDLLNLSDKNSKFIFNGRTYSIYTNQTFQDIGLIRDNSNLFIINQAISG